MPNGIINRSYYAASEQGRQDAQAEQINALRQRAMQSDLEQENYLRGIMRDPNSTPEQFARAGRSDIANSIQNLQPDRAAQAKEFATQMTYAAKYGLQSPNPKAFIEKNFPFLVETYGPDWANATDDQVRAELQGAAARFGVQAGIAPEPQPVKWVPKQGPRGSIIQENPETGEQRQVVGPDNSQPVPPGTGGPGEYRRFQMADKLRDEFNSQSKEFVSVGDSYNTVRAASTDPTAAGDLSLIFAYMKMLDPNSVVREQEFANAQNAAGVPDRIRNQWNKVLNGERLNPDQRKDFVSQAEKVYKIRLTRNKAIVDRYTNLAKRNGLDPNDVIGDFSVQEPAQAPGSAAPQAPKAPGATGSPVQVKTPQEAMALPPGTKFVTPDGRVKVRP